MIKTKEAIMLEQVEEYSKLVEKLGAYGWEEHKKIHRKIRDILILIIYQMS